MPITKTNPPADCEQLMRDQTLGRQLLARMRELAPDAADDELLPLLDEFAHLRCDDKTAFNWALDRARSPHVGGPRCKIVLTLPRPPIERDRDGYWVYAGRTYASQREACAARRRDYFALLDTGLYNYTQAAAIVGVSKRTGKVWRNGRTRACGRNEDPCRESGYVPDPE